MAIANATNGVQILGGSYNTIGGPASDSRNVISGNTTNGVVINGSGGASNNLVERNHIGTNIAGTVAVANNIGVRIWNGATGNTIGGTGNAGNVISGNATNGIDIDAAGTSDDLVIGNDIRHECRLDRRRR